LHHLRWPLMLSPLNSSFHFADAKVRSKTTYFPMPTVFTKDGFRFFFYSNDHTPIHVHVKRGNGEAVFVVDGDIVLRESVGMRTS